MCAFDREILALPPRINALVAQSEDSDAVFSTLRHYATMLSAEVSMPLFPDFTDHGINHLRTVLWLCDILIADGSNQRHDSFEAFSSADAVTLVYATLLHDVGMHLNERAFLTLIQVGNDKARIPDLDARTWPEAWEIFIEEATRWDDRTYIRIFGDAARLHETNRLRVRRPPQKPENWDDIDRRLAGEFIRRHHPRLAHEIAIYGWPNGLGSDSGVPLPVPVSEAIPKLADLAGLVARSHGCSIRSVLPYLSHRHFNLLETRDAHAVYLMTLLRVADSLHLHAERAPGGQTRIQKLASPISRREWAAHQAIYDVRLDTDADPEAVVVDVDQANLHDVTTYFRLRDWLQALQSELDHSWALLGEVYGRNPRLSKLG